MKYSSAAVTIPVLPPSTRSRIRPDKTILISLRHFLSSTSERFASGNCTRVSLNAWSAIRCLLRAIRYAASR